MKTFYQVLANTLVVTTKNNFVWFALTFWIYLSTQSVISTSVIGGMFLLANAASSMWFGSLVDHHKKKLVMQWSSIGSFFFFTSAFLLFLNTDQQVFTQIDNPLLWVFAALLMLGVVCGNIYGIAVPTLVSHLVPEKLHDKANGMYGMISGISFSITSVASGLTLAYLGMAWVLVIALLLTLLAFIHIQLITIGEKKIIHLEDKPKKMDIAGTLAIMKTIPGLFALVFFTTFNNFLGGVFMALMDAYGLSLVSVQSWGLIWGCLSFGFIIGGMIIAKRGLGKKPLTNLFRINIVIWITTIFFAIQPWLWLLIVGMIIWVVLVPFVEATEQTIIQKVVPLERQGRVFGLAHSIEQAASPLTAFLIGPIAQFIFIPFMTEGRGVELIGSWFGVGQGRGIALVFMTTGVLGLLVTLVAMRSKAYARLAKRYAS